MTRKANVWSATASAFLPGVFTSSKAAGAHGFEVHINRAAPRTSDELQRRRGVQYRVGDRRALHDEGLDAGHVGADLQQASPGTP